MIVKLATLYGRFNLCLLSYNCQFCCLDRRDRSDSMGAVHFDVNYHQMISVAFYSCLNEFCDYGHVLMMQTCLLARLLKLPHARYDVHHFFRGDLVSKSDDSSDTLSYSDYSSVRS